MWPSTYNTCDDVARYGQADWNNSLIGAQKYSACDNHSAPYGFVPFVGRGVPAIDMFELVVPPKWKDWLRGTHLNSALRLGPKIPPNTTHGAGLYGDCNTTDDMCTGVYFYPKNGHQV